MALRITRATNNEINRVVRNFNQKVRRLEKLENATNLPNTVSTRDLKNSNDRAELNRRLNELRRFSRRNATDVITLASGETISRWERTNIGIVARTAKAKVTREINRLQTTNPTVAGRKQATTFARMGDSKYLNLLAKRRALNNRPDAMNKEELRRYRKLAQQILNKRPTLTESTYATMLRDVGYVYGYPSDRIEEIIEKLNKLPIRSFLYVMDDRALQAVMYRYNARDISPEQNREAVHDMMDEIYDNIDTIIEQNT